jgi:hypothetical protein
MRLRFVDRPAATGETAARPEGVLQQFWADGWKQSGEWRDVERVDGTAGARARVAVSAQTP